MPGLTVDTSPLPQPQPQAQPPPLHTTTTTTSQNAKDPEEAPTISSSSASPTQAAPPYSPITPTLAAARLAQNNAPSPSPPHSHSHPHAQPRTCYTHTQEAQSAIAQPAPVPVRFEDNPDALALKSAISILQMQARNATRDIQALQRIKERAVGDPDGFRTALGEGRVRTRRDELFAELGEGGDDDEEDDEDGEEDSEVEGEDEESAQGKGLKRRRRRRGSRETAAWESLPTPQNVVRCPPINWNQYAVVGESLDRMHDDQVARPAEGMPQRFGPDGQYFFGGEGVRRQSDLGVAAPYTPGRDRIEKMGTRKGGKR